MSDLLDKMFRDAIAIFDIKGTAGIPYTDDGAWVPIAEMWKRRADGAIGQIILPQEWHIVSAEDARKASKDIARLAEATAGTVLDAIKRRVLGEPVAETTDYTLVSFLLSTYVEASRGLELHANGSFASQIHLGNMTEKEAATHLDRTVTILEMLAKLSEGGYLAEVAQGMAARRAQGQLGNPLIAAVLIAAIVVAGMCGMYLIDRQTYLAARAQDKAEKACKQLMEAGEYELALQCQKGILDAAGNLKDWMKPITSMTTTLAWIGGLSIVGYVGVKFIAPAVMDLMQTRRVRRVAVPRAALGPAR